MKNFNTVLLVLLFLAFSALVLAEGKITISSRIPGDVYLGGIKEGSINPGETFEITLNGTGPHIVEVRGTNTKLVHREEISFDPSRNEHRTVKAFSEAAVAASSDAKNAVTREELHAAVDQAARRAKSEALAEEAARRSRAQKREMTNRAITHVVAVEGRHLPPGVKGMERIKLLAELIPILGGRR